jgi:hypothetical protein
MDITSDSAREYVAKTEDSSSVEMLGASMSQDANAKSDIESIDNLI